METNFTSASQITEDDVRKIIKICDIMKSGVMACYVWFKYKIEQCSPLMIFYPQNTTAWNHVAFRAYDRDSDKFFTIKVTLSSRIIDIYA